MNKLRRKIKDLITLKPPKMAPKTIEEIERCDIKVSISCRFTPLRESTLIIHRFTMTTWQQGGLLKCDSYFTAYQEQPELYALSSRVVFV
mgnify:CR=1 FL=1